MEQLEGVRDRLTKGQAKMIADQFSQTMSESLGNGGTFDPALAAAYVCTYHLIIYTHVDLLFGRNVSTN